MISKLLPIVFMLPLIGCAGTNADGTKYRPESPAWHSNNSEGAKLEYFTKKCESFGFERGSEGMANCLKDTVTRSETSAKATMSRAMSRSIDTGNIDVYEPQYSKREYKTIYSR